MNTHKNLVRKFSAKLTRLLFFRRYLKLSATWLFAWGTLVVILRAGWGVSGTALLWGVLGLGAAAVLARIRLDAPSREALCAALDRENRCGGLLMAGQRVNLGGWAHRLEELTLPRVRWEGRRTWTLLGASVVYAGVSFLVPGPDDSLHRLESLEIGREIEELAEQIELLKEEALLEPFEAASLEEELRNVAQEATGKDPVNTWEALDHLESVNRQAAQMAAQKALGETRLLTEVESLATTLENEASQLSPDQLAQLMKELASMLSKAAADSSLLRSHLDRKWLEDSKKGSCSLDRLAALAGALRVSKAELTKLLTQLHDLRLIDADTLKECAKAGQCKGSGLAAFLGKNAGGASLATLLAAWLDAPGTGGISRGPGNAPMFLGEKASEQGAKFKEEVLPPSAVAALQQSIVVARSIEAPKVDDSGGAAASNVLDGASSGSGSALTRKVLPRHRGVVKRYFERNHEGKQERD